MGKLNKTKRRTMGNIKEIKKNKKKKAILGEKFKSVLPWCRAYKMQFENFRPKGCPQKKSHKMGKK